MRNPGLVIASHGRHVMVEAPDGSRLLCHPRGKKNQAVVGDRVQWLPSGDEGSIEAIEPRRNLFYRQDEIRTKSFAANLDLLLVLIAAEPEFSQEQLTRALIAAEAEGIAPLIVLNKQDLGATFDLAWERLQPYSRMGYEVLPLSLKESTSTPGLQTMVERLRGRTTLVLGPSGAGKSSLINRLVPDAGATTGELSTALQSGRHTTTTTTWYWVDRVHATALIDSPGFQAFGLHHIESTALAGLMPDLRAHSGECRFYNCSHLHEPGCQVQQAVANGDITETRYRLYRQLHDELSRPSY
jgi:ribosome biogenesis GTPase